VEKIREPIVEGIFYPSDRGKLAKLVTSLVESADVADGQAWGILAPHAGFRYSGAIAATAFKAARARTVRTVVILAPLHRTEKDEILFPESGLFRMPAGNIRVDRAAVAELVTCSTQFLLDDISHLEEHSIEVQLPFIASLFPDAAIVPILLGCVKRGTLTALVRALELVFADRDHDTLYVVSANLTSFMQGTAARAEAALILEALTANQPETLLTGLETGTISSRGVPAMAALLLLAGRTCRAEILSSGSSAETNRDFREMVHYAAVAFHRKKV
jgi:AmmeMemoRadiSam system protein B